MSQATVLYDLQQLDNEIRAKKQRLGDVLRLQKEPAALLAAREKAQAVEDDLQKWQARHRALSLEIGSLTDKAKRSEERLYSGAVKNPKELTDLQHEVEGLGRRKVMQEDEALLVMMEIDDRKAAKAEADAEVERLLTEFTNASSTLRAEQQTLALALNGLLEKRARQVALVQPQFLKIYDDLARQKHGLAVAGMRHNKCLGCQLTLSESVVRAVIEGKLVRCEHCGRILCAI